MQFDLTPAQRALQAKARELARGPIAERAAEIDRSEEYPWDNVALLKEAGYFGMTIPAAYGGKGASYLDAVLVIEEMAKCCGITGRIVVEANMGAIGAIMKYGSEAQKRLAAELVLAGDKPAICITEPGAGSAASEMTTRADRRGNGFVINGKKHWITGGGVSRLHLVFARVFDEQGEEEGIGGFIAIRDETQGPQDRQARAGDGTARHPRGRDHLRGHGGDGRRAGLAAARAEEGLCRSDERL